VTPPIPSWNDALTSARRAISSGQRELREAARSIADGVRDLRQGDPEAPQRIAADVVELSQAAQTIKASVAVVRADREIGEEILDMVRHDSAAQDARDTRPRPGRQPLRRGIDILA
jgi:hypothetical protein